jgi:hypothetical protein
MSLGSEESRAPACDGTAVLIREVRVRLLNWSGSGCLVETDRRIEIGTAATLRVMIDGKEYRDDVQVLRCQSIAGAGSVYHVGMQFLWTEMPHERSIRHALAQRAGSIATPNAIRVN